MHLPFGASLQVEDDGETYTFWEDMLWPPLHGKSARFVSDSLGPPSYDFHRQCWPYVSSKLALHIAVAHLEPLSRLRETVPLRILDILAAPARIRMTAMLVCLAYLHVAR